MNRIIVMLAMVMAVAFGIEAKRIVGYVTSWSNVMPDPKLLTNINYAFGHVNDTFDGVRIDNPDRLKRIVELKNATVSWRCSCLSVVGVAVVSVRWLQMTVCGVRLQPIAARWLISMDLTV